MEEYDKLAVVGRGAFGWVLSLKAIKLYYVYDSNNN